MKKLCILLFMMYSTSLFALKTTLTSSIYANQASGAVTQQIVPPISFGPHKVRIINRIDSLPEYATALSQAEVIFSNAMLSEQIDLVEIKADLLMGSHSDFGDNAICKVCINYSDTIYDHCNYHNFCSLYSPFPVIYPSAMTNQTRGNSTDVDMHIYLNPTLTYHSDVTQLDANDYDKYDLITILLRALAIGCGIQSSIDPVTMQLYYEDNDIKYITAFDTQIFNDDDHYYVEVGNGDIDVTTFLAWHSAYVNGYDNMGNPYLVELYNDWAWGSQSDVSANTLNTVDPEIYTQQESANGFIDLLDAYLTSGVSIRYVTPYTMALLRRIGWEKTVPVGPNPYEALYSSTLSCSNIVLSPNTTYSVNFSAGNEVDINDVVCKLKSTDSSYVVGSVINDQSFSYSSIPQNIQWQRNPITKNIVGQFQGTAGMFVNSEYITQPKTYDIEIPYIPNRPIIHKSENTSNNSIQLHLKAFANGSDTYTVSYVGVSNSSYTNTFTVSADALDTVITNIPANQLYNATIYGTNSIGNSSTYNFTFGFSAHPALTMNVFIYPNNTLVYDLSSNGLIDISDVVISSVQVRNVYGNLMYSSTVGSGIPIDISGLSSGRYVLTVVADGNTYSKLFIRR